MNFLQQPLAGLPLWMWLIAGAAAIGLAFWMRRQTSGGKTLGQNTAGQTAAIDSNIDPNTGVPWQVEEGINPNTGLPNYYGGPGIDTGTGTTGGTGGTGTTATTTTGMIRQKLTSGQTAAYDQSHNGVPLDAQPGTGTEGQVPFGATVTTIGKPVQGPSNLGTTGWEQVSYGGMTGYVSLFDLTNGGTQSTPFWPVPTDLGGPRNPGDPLKK